MKRHTIPKFGQIWTNPSNLSAVRIIGTANGKVEYVPVGHSMTSAGTASLDTFVERYRQAEPTTTVNVHPVVLATIRKHLAETELRLAILRSKREEIPATRGGMVAASRVARQIAQAQQQCQSWVDVLNAAETIGDNQ